MSKKVLKEQTLKNYDFIDAVSEKVTTISEEIIEIPLKDIIIKENVRKDYTNIEELASSIQEQSMLQPVMVSKRNDGYAIIYGHRRFRAYQMLNEKYPNEYGKIKAIVKNDINENDVSEIQLIENIQRENLSAIEMKDALECLRKKGYSNKIIAGKIGKSSGYVEQIFSAVKTINENPTLSEVISKTDVNISLADVAEVKSLPHKKQIQVLKDRAKGKIKTQKNLRAVVRDVKRNMYSDKNKIINEFIFDLFRKTGSNINIHPQSINLKSITKDQRATIVKKVQELLKIMKQ